MYEELIKRLRAVVDGGREEKCDGCPYEEDYPCCVDCLDKLHKQAADAIEALMKDLNDCRNELCLKCGIYKDRHLGACNGCRWQSVEEKDDE